ncbi:hypothetical protein BC628DRAFT_1353815 [Trametes gibbosa]|nr:hypothetical protein BC628DRAFT_1353815 [Trametes gibbosa]
MPPTCLCLCAPAEVVLRSLWIVHTVYTHPVAPFFLLFFFSCSPSLSHSTEAAISSPIGDVILRADSVLSRYHHQRQESCMCVTR